MKSDDGNNIIILTDEKLVEFFGETQLSDIATLFAQGNTSDMLKKYFYLISNQESVVESEQSFNLICLLLNKIHKIRILP